MSTPTTTSTLEETAKPSSTSTTTTTLRVAAQPFVPGSATSPFVTPSSVPQPSSHTTTPPQLPRRSSSNSIHTPQARDSIAAAEGSGAGTCTGSSSVAVVPAIDPLSRKLLLPVTAVFPTRAYGCTRAQLLQLMCTEEETSRTNSHAANEPSASGEDEGEGGDGAVKGEDSGREATQARPAAELSPPPYNPHTHHPVSSLCMLYLQGRCRQGGSCHQVHAEPSVVATLRAEAQAAPTCCALHGEPSTPALLEQLFPLSRQKKSKDDARTTKERGGKEDSRERDNKEEEDVTICAQPQATTAVFERLKRHTTVLRVYDQSSARPPPPKYHDNHRRAPDAAANGSGGGGGADAFKVTADADGREDTHSSASSHTVRLLEVSITLGLARYVSTVKSRILREEREAFFTTKRRGGNHGNAAAVEENSGSSGGDADDDGHGNDAATSRGTPPSLRDIHLPSTLPLPSHLLCRLHAMDRCGYAADCRLVHVCRDHPVMATIRATAGGGGGGDGASNHYNHHHHHHAHHQHLTAMGNPSDTHHYYSSEHQHHHQHHHQFHDPQKLFDDDHNPHSYTHDHIHHQKPESSHNRGRGHYRSGYGGLSPSSGSYIHPAAADIHTYHHDERHHDQQVLLYPNGAGTDAHHHGHSRHHHHHLSTGAPYTAYEAGQNAFHHQHHQHDFLGGGLADHHHLTPTYSKHHQQGGISSSRRSGPPLSESPPPRRPPPPPTASTSTTAAGGGGIGGFTVTSGTEAHEDEDAMSNTKSISPASHKSVVGSRSQEATEEGVFSPPPPYQQQHFSPHTLLPPAHQPHHLAAQQGGLGYRHPHSTYSHSHGHRHTHSRSHHSSNTASVMSTPGTIPHYPTSGHVSSNSTSTPPIPLQHHHHRATATAFAGGSGSTSGGHQPPLNVNLFPRSVSQPQQQQQKQQPQNHSSTQESQKLTVGTGLLLGGTVAEIEEQLKVEAEALPPHALGPLPPIDGTATSHQVFAADPLSHHPRHPGTQQYLSPFPQPHPTEPPFDSGSLLTTGSDIRDDATAGSIYASFVNANVDGGDTNRSIHFQNDQNGVRDVGKAAAGDGTQKIIAKKDEEEDGGFDLQGIVTALDL